MHESPGATVTRGHQLGSFRQQKCLLSPFWSRKSETKVSLPPEALQEDPASLPLTPNGPSVLLRPPLCPVQRHLPWE